MSVVKLFQPTVVLNDGTTFDGSCGLNEATDDLWINLENVDMTFVEVVTIFSNSEKTQNIRVNRTEETYDEFKGYTKLKTVTTPISGKVSICMKR